MASHCVTDMRLSTDTLLSLPSAEMKEGLGDLVPVISQILLSQIRTTHHVSFFKAAWRHLR